MPASPWKSSSSSSSPAAIAHRLLAAASFSRYSSSTSTVMQPRFAPGTDPRSVEPALTSLLDSWQLTLDGRALERTFRFKTFAKTWDFMTSVALQAKIHNHHPEWSNVFNTTLIRWTTHNPLGLSQKDVRLAAICDAIADDFQEVDPKESVGNAVHDNLVTKVVTDAGDCCSQGKKV